MNVHRTPRFLLAATVAAITGCASPGPVPQPVSAAALPAVWNSPLPHGGRLEQLASWWAQFDDPLLVRLIDSAERASPNLASASARIAQARAARVASGAALLPAVSVGAGASRGRGEVGQPAASIGSASLDFSWEIDLFGAGSAGASASQARMEAAQADWHGARVLVAAETATDYLRLRACESRLALARVDAASRQETLRLNVASAQNGMQSPGNAALSRASAAQAAGTAVQVRAECDLMVKALVAMTAMEEAVLRAQLAQATGRMPLPAGFEVAELPARVLAQRPDLAGAERQVQGAAADVAQREAQRYPRISLGGSLGRGHVSSGGFDAAGPVWSVGPVSVTLPVFDGGTTAANVTAARARQAEAAALYRSKLRTAIREVEEALVMLHSTGERAVDALVAADGFGASFRSTEARWRGGLASLFELEDARRSDVQAQVALVELQRERVLAWVALYRAVGGGWEGDLHSAPHFTLLTESAR